ncbi:DUF2339 domain-containing protein [Paenibacillus sp. LHD-38]|uniref:DUF2339 domain-containing protein n=1 Tax=Paenibacillus sp. LHD-38 TaxID=3072143 RepID=UPI00280C7C4B|nr:DUF2339 domain-containing protein [Paenibacillus sp. LHD-38]MDQ8736823.1 DUF2339 domain-containing protein [Paenibacillus sp. LHD-38]
MKEIVYKHWTSLLGVLFVMTAFITLFKYSVEQGWITEAMKIGFGLLGGAGISVIGLKLASRVPRNPIGEIMIGMGACILYATFAFAGIYYRLWDPMTILLGMSAVTIGISLYALKYQARLLMIMAMLGGLLSPLLMRPETDQVFALFLYMLVLNVAFFFLSITRGWHELRIISFIGSWLMYIVYFIHYDPSTEGLWSMPIRYALAAFLFYTIGLMISSWRNKLIFEGTDLYLNGVNGILFGFWALLILQGEVPYGYILIFIGIVYMLVSFVIYQAIAKITPSAAGFFLGGLLLLLVSLSSIGGGYDSKPLVTVLLWGIIAVFAAAIGHAKSWQLLSLGSLVTWFVVGCYWYVVTWDTPRGEWFGMYIPFLNWGAFAWILLAALGFYFSRKLIIPQLTDQANLILARVYALLAHLIVGGLLTRQIENIFTEYMPDSSTVYLALALSVSWGCYSLLLILWGAFYRELLFKWFGSAVLLIVAIKAIFMDLSGQEALYKVGVLLTLGAISFFVTWINGKWRMRDGEAVSLSDDAAHES